MNAEAGTASDGYRWLSENDEVLREGIIWNDAIGDGKDRYKSGGITHGWVIPDVRFTREPWFNRRVAAVELQGRGFIATPENTQNPAAGDRPFAEYFAIGAYLRTIGMPRPVGPALTKSTEDRIGLELGLLGDPLPFFEIQDVIHSGSVNNNPSNTLDGQFLANIEARRTWRYHQQLNDTDLEFAPFVQVSAGMRENSVRIGGDIIYGSSLEGRLWNHDLATGAMYPGGSAPREGPQLMVWMGADAGYVASDAMLDGGFLADGPSADREPLTGRVRAGVMVEMGDAAVGYSMTWLSEEFRGQKHSQVIGAVTVKLRF
ncbi:MAG: lipid A-modifier LpxR family protein [Paracoccaceae bacterium]